MGFLVVFYQVITGYVVITGILPDYLQSGPVYSKVHESGKNTALVVYLPSIILHR